MAKITTDAERIARGQELMQIDAGIASALSRLSAYQTQLDGLKAAMTDAVYTADDKAAVDAIKQKITDALK